MFQDFGLSRQSSVSRRGHVPMPPAFLEHVAAVFRVLGDPSRLQILQALMAGPRTVSEVVELTGKGQANVSKHLGTLAQAELVSRTPRGTRVIYQVADPLVFDLCALVCSRLRARISRQIHRQQKLLRP